MEFLTLVPQEQRNDVRDVVEDDALSVDDKIGVLGDMVSSRVLTVIVKFLEEHESGGETGSSEDFLSLVDREQKKRVMRILLDRGDITALEKMIAKEDHEVQTAFDNWRNGQKSKKKPSPAPSTPPTRNRANSSFRQTGSTNNKFNKNKSFDSDDTDSFSKLSVSHSETPSDPEEEEDEFQEESAADTAPEIDGSFFDKFPECLNILILGETGVGKSTFINGLINYLKFGTINEALKNQVEILIKTYFTHTDEDYNRMRIECDPTVEVERGGDGENENTVDGQSSTQAPKSYVFSWGPKGSRKAIRIIDTPGVGDVRGVDQERMNFAKILSFIADFKEIHAICVLLKPNESKLTLTFRYCINELLSHLHVSASKNILFCFTNARQTLYRPGDTLPTLEAHLNELEKTRGISIPLDSRTMFCFDNESFRFLCALREGANFEQKDVQNFNLSWVKTVEETFRMFKRISELPVHNVNETLSVNNLRAVILALARPLAEIARNQMLNVKLIEDKLREIDDYMKNGKDLEGRLYVDQVKIHAKEIDYPITVCTAKECVEYMRFSNNPNAAMETVYKTECHARCYLTGVQVSLVPNPDLQQCWAMSNDIDHCRTCNCPWSTHMHIRYKLEKTMEKTVDPTVQTSIKNRDDQIQTANLFLEKETQTSFKTVLNQNVQKEALQKEAERISQCCVEFAAFLRKNSILPYNDVYKEYVEHLIKEEKDKISQGGSDVLLKRLQSYRDEYEQQVKILESHGKASTSTKTIKQIYNMVDELKRMKNCGSILNEIQKLELLSVRDQQITKVTPVDLNTGWLGQMTGSMSSNYKKAKKVASKFWYNKKN